jgi:hypothetical protein
MFLTQLYNPVKDQFEIGYIVKDLTNWNYKCLTVDISSIELSREGMKSAITSANHYLAVWENRLIYFFDVFKNQILLKTDDIGSMECVWNVLNTNNFIIKQNSSIYLLQFSKYTHELRKTKIKELQTENFTLNLEKDYLVIKFFDYFEVYRVEQFIKGMRPDLLVKNKVIDVFCFTESNKYLVVFTKTDELCVYKLNRTMKQIACLVLNHKIENMHASEKYINFKLDSKLLSFEILVDGI